MSNHGWNFPEIRFFRIPLVPDRRLILEKDIPIRFKQLVR